MHRHNRERDENADIMMINLDEERLPVFQESCAFEQRDLTSKGKGKTTVHVNGSDHRSEQLFSVNQLNIH